VSSDDEALTLLAEGVALQKAGDHAQALRRFVDAAKDPNPRVAAEALRRQASIYRLRSKWPEAISATRASAELARAHGHVDLEAEALNAEAIVYQVRGAFDEAVPLLNRVLDLIETTHPKIRGNALQNLGAIAAQQGDFPAAKGRFLEAAEAFRKAGYAWGEANVLNNFARAALDHGNFTLAAELLRNAHAAARRVGDKDLISLSLMNLAEATLGLGNSGQAQEQAEEALMFFSAEDNAPRQIECLRILGDVFNAQKQLDAAISCWEQALQLATEHEATSELRKLGPRLSNARSTPNNG
jgi:tetratricopeptide (TPR) repeat protein